MSQNPKKQHLSITEENAETPGHERELRLMGRNPTLDRKSYLMALQQQNLLLLQQLALRQPAAVVRDVHGWE
jgi:hypothetical protein